jgi:transcriptional regulator with PAS, ATPase and Fis domain
MSGIQEIKQRFGIIGNSAALERAIEKARQVAFTDISVLVTGESGVGKESIPRIIHSLSARKHKPYIAVNCGAIPEGTIDSELFGHEKGAFTGATNLRKGYFEEADGGTIFLDEVGELPLSTQVRLLRVLETGEFIKVGSSRIQKTDVRIVAATNLDMEKAIRNNRFREDLYYRLNTVEILLPPLRDRPEDIHLIFRKFAADFADKYSLPPIRLDASAIELLNSFRWPGNIRQLRNLAEQISVVEEERLISAEILTHYLPQIIQSQNELPVSTKRNADGESDFANEREILYKILFDMRNDLNDLKKLTLDLMKSGGGDGFEEEHEGILTKLYKETNASTGSQSSRLLPAPSTSVHTAEINSQPTEDELFYDAESVEEDAPISLHEKELEMIKIALERNKGRRKDAANELGISERTLYRKIKQYDL